MLCYVILFKLAEIVQNGKNGIPLFCFIFKMDTNEDIRVKRFSRFFLTVHVFLSLKFDKISWRPSLEPKELRSVEISWLSFMVKKI
jgi:hypothetical protein